MSLKRAFFLSSLMVLTIAVLAAVSPLGARWLYGGPRPLGALPPPPPGSIPPAANLTVAFIGDTGTDEGFTRVLELIRAEGARAVVHLGDAIYDHETPAQFWGVVDRVLGHDFAYFLAQGNHDLAGWRALAAHAYEHVRPAGAVTRAPGFDDPRFDIGFGGLSLLLLGQAPRDDDPRAIATHFARDNHIWKICGWHKNQNTLQVGGKDDEMGWGVYEACRQMGALIVTAHEHSYQRTRTLIDTVDRTVDPGCADPARVCVRPGAVPVFVSGLGGRSIRDQERCLPTTFPYGCNQEWAFIYTSNQDARFGALFLTFHHEGDPKKARGYFKNVAGAVVDEFVLVTP